MFLLLLSGEGVSHSHPHPLDASLWNLSQFLSPWWYKEKFCWEEWGNRSWWYSLVPHCQDLTWFDLFSTCFLSACCNAHSLRYELTRTAITKYHRWGELNNRNFFSHSSCGQSPRSGSSWFGFWWGLFLACRWPPSHYVLTLFSECMRKGKGRDQALWCLFL